MDQFKTNKRSCPKFGLFGPNKIYANNSQLGPMYNNTKKYNKYSWAHSPILILQKKKKEGRKIFFPLMQQIATLLWLDATLAPLNSQFLPFHSKNILSNQLAAHTFAV